jgi:spore coat protein U-like protein
MKISVTKARLRSGVRPALWAALLVTLSPGFSAQAANCRLTVTPLAFGLYDPGATAPLDVTGQLDVRCTGSPGSFLVTISTGVSASYATRHMLFGPYRLEYNLYVDAARSQIWGDGTGGTSVNSGNKPRAGQPVSFSFPIYARIFPRQNIGEGLYTDTLLVTSVF